MIGETTSRREDRVSEDRGEFPYRNRPPLAYESAIAHARASIVRELAGDGAGIHAVTVALVDDERLLWAEALGSIDRTRGLAPTIETLFCAASLSKVVAAVATMILVDRGLIELDAPLVRYVKDFRMADGEAYRAITVRMLLNHSSGLPGTHFGNILTTVPVSGYAAQVRDALATERLKHAPGEMVVYCNDGFAVIELLVSEVTGRPYTDFVRAEILEPLEMSNSRFALDRFDPGSFAPGLDAAGRPEPQEYVNVYSGGLFSTPTEIGRLAMMFLNRGSLAGRRLLSWEAVAEMGRDQTEGLPLNPITDHDFHCGLGWDGVRQGGLAAVGVTAWHKAGDADHSHSFLIVAPDERLAVVVMLTNDSSVGGIARVLAERILLDALAERGSIAEVPRPLEPSPSPAVPASDEELASVAGIYVSSYGPRRLDVRAGHALTLSSYVDGHWQPTIEELRLRRDGRLVADGCPEVAYRRAVAAGRGYLAVRRPFGLGHYQAELPVGHELPPGKPLSARWQARVGRRWLTVNDPYSAFLALGRQPPLLSLGEVQGLEGYVAVSVIAAGMTVVQVVDPQGGDDLARMCLKIPVDNAWGLSDLVVIDRDGDEWVSWAGVLYRPLGTVPLSGLGQGAVTIGREGSGEWRQLAAASALTVAGARAWYLYTPGFALLAWGLERGGVGAIPAGAYLQVHGAPDTTILVALA
jgi:CubicO group peptidase (beta-lactamase class C family)